MLLGMIVSAFCGAMPASRRCGDPDASEHGGRMFFVTLLMCGAHWFRSTRLRESIGDGVQGMRS